MSVSVDNRLCTYTVHVKRITTSSAKQREQHGSSLFRCGPVALRIRHPGAWIPGDTGDTSPQYLPNWPICYNICLTAAFDTVDHDLLMLRLERQFGLRGVVLQRFSSYLSGRSFRVVFGCHMSAFVVILCYVPQGSVLGPDYLLCIQWTWPWWHGHTTSTSMILLTTLNCICSLSSHRHDVHYCTSGRLSGRRQPLDVRQQVEVKPRQDGITLGRLETQPLVVEE